MKVVSLNYAEHERHLSLYGDNAVAVQPTHLEAYRLLTAIVNATDSRDMGIHYWPASSHSDEAYVVCIESRHTRKDRDAARMIAYGYMIGFAAAEPVST